jgi:hypothetical protein
VIIRELRFGTKWHMPVFPSVSPEGTSTTREEQHEKSHLSLSVSSYLNSGKIVEARGKRIGDGAERSPSNLAQDKVELR